VNSQASQLSEIAKGIAKGKQTEHVEPAAKPEAEKQKKKGGRARGKRLVRKHDRSSGERLRKSVDE
jgi:hypothetical protein